MHALQDVHEVSISDVGPDEASLPNKEQPYAGLALVRDPQTILCVHCLTRQPLYAVRENDDLHAGRCIHAPVARSFYRRAARITAAPMLVPYTGQAGDDSCEARKNTWLNIEQKALVARNRPTTEALSSAAVASG